MKLCKDCKHFAPETELYRSACRVVDISVVDGSPTRWCGDVRGEHGECGKDAVLFEQKEPHEWTDGIAKHIVGAVIGAVMVAPLLIPLFK